MATAIQMTGGGGKRERLGTAAKKRMAAPYLAAQMPHTQIARLLEVSESTVSRWASSAEVKAEVAETIEVAREAAMRKAQRVGLAAWDALAELLEADDDAIRLEAAKTTLDRVGWPARKEVTGDGAQPTTAIQIVVTDEARLALASERKAGE